MGGPRAAPEHGIRGGWLYVSRCICSCFRTHDDEVVPLVYFLDRMPLLEGNKTHTSETTLVKVIRSFASEVFDVRMLMSSPSRAVWYGRTTSKDDTGGYEIRLKGWKDAITRAGGMTKGQWDERTIYLVCDGAYLIDNESDELHRKTYHLRTVPLQEYTASSQAS